MIGPAIQLAFLLPQLTQPLCPYERLCLSLWAVWSVESSRSLDPPPGDNGKAVGPLQIWEVTAADANRIANLTKRPKGATTQSGEAPLSGKATWSSADRNSLEASVEIFVVISMHYTPSADPELVCRRWNGGPTGEKKDATLAYWHRCQLALESYKETLR